MSSNQPESFRGHLPALAGSIVGTLLAAIVGSHIGGALGGRYALALGAAVSGTASWYGERAIRRAHSIAKARLRFEERHGRKPNVEETQLIERVFVDIDRHRFSGVHYRTIGLLVLTALAVCFVTILSLDALGARAVANVTPPPAPVVTQTSYLPGATETVTQQSETPTPSLSPTPTVSPSATPSVSPDATSTTISSSESATPVTGGTSAGSTGTPG